MVVHYDYVPSGADKADRRISAAKRELIGVVPQATDELALAMQQESTIGQPMTKRQQAEMDKIIRAACDAIQKIHLDKRKDLEQGHHPKSYDPTIRFNTDGRRFISATRY